MDILKAKNVERLLYEITGDPERVTLWMNGLENEKYFAVDKRTARTTERNILFRLGKQ